jgi:hypothetical protein
VFDPVCRDAHGQVLPVASAGHGAVTAIPVRCEEGNAYRELEHQRGRVFHHARVVMHPWLWSCSDGMEFLEGAEEGLRSVVVQKLESAIIEG